jgi:hypothetical protein
VAVHARAEGRKLDRRQQGDRHRADTAARRAGIPVAHQPRRRSARSKTATHTHPGSEAFYVLAGRMSQRTSHGTVHLDAGQSAPGHGADMPMEVSSSGATDLDQLVMFVVDATRPFSSPAKFD